MAMEYTLIRMNEDITLAAIRDLIIRAIFGTEDEEQNGLRVPLLRGLLKAYRALDMELEAELERPMERYLDSDGAGALHMDVFCKVYKGNSYDPPTWSPDIYPTDVPIPRCIVIKVAQASAQRENKGTEGYLPYMDSRA